MSKDYRDGYKDGFKDGYEEGKRQTPITYPLAPYPTINAKASISGAASGIVANNSWVAINGGEWSCAPSLDAEQENPTYMRTDGWANK